MDFKENLKKYAKLIVQIGVNIEKDQELMIRSPIEGAYFARELAEYAYQAGAKKVYVEYQDEELSKLTYTYASHETLGEYPSWIAEGYNELAKRGAAFISISASNPDLLKDIEPEKISIFQKAAGKALETYKRYISNSEVTWCVVSIPTLSWSKKLFPQMSEEEGVKLLWEKIFQVTRIDEEDPVKAWKVHTDQLTEKCTFLNDKKIKTLKYKAPGTDLTVELPTDHIWLGGGEYSTKGTYFVANMPTEEVFTMPYKYGVEGVLASTKPLNWGGNLIEDFTLVFKEGKIVECSAKKGEELLKKLIATDEGACYLGEVAIVPHSSPVSASQMIFFNTLFDENASCHFAIGSSYPITIKNGVHMSKEELEKQGANTSIIHEDFMVGSQNMTIEATTEEGEKFYLIQDGEWAF